MVPFLTASDISAIVQRFGLEKFWLRLIEYLERDFRRWESFEKSPRLAIHSAHGVIELMPTSDERNYCFKFVNGHPSNTLRGLQTVAAFGVLADVATGYPLLLADMTLATAFRTAGVSALAASFLARRESKTMALIGLGAQAEFQAHAFQSALHVGNMRIFDIDLAATEKFERNMADSGISIVRCGNVGDAVTDADIITTITADKQRVAILSDNMVGAGMHINTVGGDCPGKTELARDILSRAEIFVEYAPQTRAEGEIQQLAADHPVTELWEVIVGSKPGRTSDRAITIFDAVGFAIEDFSVMRLLRDLAEETGVKNEIDLIARPQNPKDLFGLLMAPNRDWSFGCA